MANKQLDNWIYTGANVCYILGIRNAMAGETATSTITDPDPATSVSFNATTKANYRLLFNSGQQIAYKINLPGASTAGGTTIDQNLADGCVYKFPKTGKDIDAATGTEIVSAETTGTGYGEVTLTVVGADLDSASFADMLTRIDTYGTDEVLVIFPTGFTITSNAADKVDGWGYMVGKRTNNIEITQGAGGSTFALTYAATAISGTYASAFKAAVAGLDEQYELGIPARETATDGTGLIPEALDASTDATALTNLAAGKVILKKSTLS